MKLHERCKLDRWNACWIHHAVTGSGPIFVMFRKAFTVDEAPCAAEIRISADRHYKLFVDGDFIGEGPLRANIHYWSYDTYDLTDRLTIGPHAISALVSKWNPCEGDPLALIVQCSMRRRDGGSIELLSDDTWKCLRAGQWRSDVPPNVWIGPLQNGYLEVQDMRNEPIGWTEAAFDDGGWDSVQVFARYESAQKVRTFGAKWDWLAPRELPFFQHGLHYPVKLCALGEVCGSEIYCNKAKYNEQWWAGIEEILPLQYASVVHPEGMIVGGRCPAEFTVRYVGRSFGRMIRQPAAVVDFGRLMNGYIELDVEADEGLVLDITYAQTCGNGKIHPGSGGILRFNRYVLRGGLQRIESCEWHNLRYLQLTVRGDVGKGYAARMKLHSLAVRSIEYPIVEKGSFDCSDSLLTATWDATLRTTQLCMLDVFMDNTFREKGGWGGDISQMALSALTCFGNVAVIRRYLGMFLLEQSPSGVIPSGIPGWGSAGMGSGGIFDHAMAIPMRIVQYYEYTGDEVFLREAYPSLRKYMEFVERYEEEDGTLGDVPGYLWFDWADLDRRLPSVLLNFYYCLLLKHMKRAARYVQCNTDADIYGSKAQKILSRSSAWWQDDAKAFPDSALYDSQRSFSEDANALALLCLQDRSHMDEIIRSLFSDGFALREGQGAVQSGPPFALYVLQGLCKADRHELACDYLRQRHALAIAQGLETMPESWIFFDNGETSAAQGTLAAAFILTSEILGIKPLTPGFGTILFEPHPAGLHWARGAIPTPGGLVSACWENRTSFSMQVEIPQDMLGVVRLPCRGEVMPVCDTADGITKENGRWHVRLPHGSHSVRLNCPIPPG